MNLCANINEANNGATHPNPNCDNLNNFDVDGYFSPNDFFKIKKESSRVPDRVKI